MRQVPRQMSYPPTMTGNPEDSKWYVTPQKKRRRKLVTVTLSDEARERLEKMSKAWKVSKSQVIEELILKSAIRP